MANVCVITGGGSGMGLEAAKFMPKDKIIVISGRTLSKLEGAIEQLKALGYDANSDFSWDNAWPLAEQVGISTATISRVSRCLNYGAGGYRMAIDRIKEEEV